MKIRNKLNISFIAIFVFVATIFTLFVGIYTTNVIKNNIFLALSSGNESRAEHIRTFINDEKKTSVVLAASSVYRNLLKEPATSEQYSSIKAGVDNRLARTLKADPSIKEVFIIDRYGIILASSNKMQEGMNKSRDDYFTKAQRDTFLKDIYFSETTQSLNYTISSPIFDDNEDFLGISVLRYSPSGFFSIVKNKILLNGTEDNFLINKDKYFLTPTLFLSSSVILKEKVETKNANDCFEPKEIEYVNRNGYIGLVEAFGSQIVEGKDYRDVDVVATHSYIPETGWCLITKINKADLLSFQNTLIFILISLSIIAFLFLFLLGLVVSRRITKPIYLLQAGVEKIKQGIFDFNVEVKSKDEVGELASSFNLMIEEVNKSKLEIEKKVKEQTKEIKNKAKDLGDQKKAILNILEDVEKEKEKTQQTAIDLEKFKLAVENASDHIVITDKEGIILYANKGVERITGFSSEEVVGHKAGSKENWGGMMDKKVYQNLWQTIKKEKKIFVGELKNNRKNGEEYEVKVSISPILNKKGDVLFFVGIERDITKERQIDRAKTEFVSLASHQLRTPLSAINWYAEMLLAGDAGKLSKKQKDFVDEIYNGNQRMVSLVNALLNVSRIELGTLAIDPKPTDFSAIAESVLGELKNIITQKELIIESKYDSTLSKIDADPNIIRIIFQNLLTNSVKYTPEKGKVIVTLEKKEPNILIKIIDTGYGIPKNQSGRIFEKMFRADNVKERDAGGTGLGLFLVKKIVEDAGGKIWFESEENKGTIFSITLPLSGMQKKDGSKTLSEEKL